jgi:hypothetical protein
MAAHDPSSHLSRKLRTAEGKSMQFARFFAGVTIVSSVLIHPAALAGGSSVPGSEPGVVEVIAKGLEFYAPREIPSGWTTFRFINTSGMTHFALIERMPDDIGIVEQQAQVAPVFQQGLDLLVAGEMDAATQKFGELPEWFGQVVFKGGPGLLGPGRTAETTVNLEPGTYLLECYVKTGGIFHSYNPVPSQYGMVREFAVSDQASDRQEPAATLRLTISSMEGIKVEGDPAIGDHIVAVRFEDQTVHENFVGHDLHLARLTDNTDLQQLAAWMDWSRPGGLETPAPAQFLGGVNEMPAGETGYMHVRLEPGRYVWVSEVTDPGRKGMLKTFVVPSDAGGQP